MSHLVHRSDFLLSRNSADQRCSSGASRARSGFTLIEVMIAVTVTLLMMLGLAQMFKVLGDSMNKGRAGLELNNRLRGILHRVRTDLDNVTAQARPPITVGSGQGYLKYYEGPASDYTLGRVFPNGTMPVPPTGELNPLLNRFGDVDDIFMATVKAKDTWFTGKVPSFIVQGRPPTNTDLYPQPNGIPDDLEEFVTISSQFAEIVIFAQPTVTSVNNPTRNPLPLLADQRNFEISDGGDVPKSYRLHYRALLIRPDLNVRLTLSGSTAIDALPAQVTGSGTPAITNENIMVARPQRNPANPSNFLASPLCDMSLLYQYCDLSVRRIDHSGVSFVAANSLEDLANPANRFAHVVLPLNGTGDIWSMPVLALGSSINPTDPDYTFQGPSPIRVGAGFLHPAYVLYGDRTGEDLLATDLLAFDLRAYDPSAPVISYDPTPALPNPENRVITLRPGDPGFLPVGLTGLLNGQSATVAYGEFVDLNWAGKFYDTLVQRTTINSLISNINFNRNLIQSALSGRQADGSIAESLFRSGSVKLLPNGSVQIFQPAYDTYTNEYESDGVFQAEIQTEGRGLVGTSRDPASVVTIPWNRTSIDAGTDGIDNNASASPGIDDSSELETSPPFPVHLRGLQISIRLEDGSKKQFKQMSAVKEFVTN